MATIRPDQLPPSGAVSPSSAIVVDDGLNVKKATPLQVMDAARPKASKLEAEEGTDNEKIVTPLRVSQAIDALGASRAEIDNLKPFTDLTAFKAQDVANGAARLITVDGTVGYTWVPGSSGTPDDDNFIASTFPGAPAGNWEKQGAETVSWIRDATGAVIRSIGDWFTDQPSVMDFIPLAERVKIRLKTSTVDMTAAFHAARDAVNGTGGSFLVPAGKYVVSELVFSGANYEIDCNGAFIQQKAGLTTNGDGMLHPIITFPEAAHDIRMGDIHLTGNIATDYNEYSHGIIVQGDNITLGNVTGKDIRGDVIYTYGRTTSPSEYQWNLVTGVVTGDNVLRCVVAQAGGDATIKGIIQINGCGYKTYDAEPNAEASYQPVTARIGFIRGGSVQLTSAGGGNINGHIRIGVADLDGDKLVDSTPAYGGWPGLNDTGLSVSSTDTLEVGALKVRNYDSYPVSLGVSWKAINIGIFDFANCETVGSVFKSMVVQQGTAGAGVLNIGSITGTLSANDRFILRSDAGHLKVNVGSINASGGLFGARLTGTVGQMTLDCGGGGGNICVNSCENMTFGPTTITNSAAAYGFVSCTNLTLATWTATFGSGLDYSGSSNIIAINSAINGSTAVGINMLSGGAFVKALAGRGASIATPAGGSTIDSEARTAITAILARMRDATPSIAT